jgi:hypothetical protein
LLYQEIKQRGKNPLNVMIHSMKILPSGWDQTW